MIPSARLRAAVVACFLRSLSCGSPNAWRARSAICTHGASRTATSKRRISSSPPTLPAMTRALFLSILAPRDASNQATSVAQASLALWLIWRRRYSHGMAMVCTLIGGRLACCFMRRNAASIRFCRTISLMETIAVNVAILSFQKPRRP